MSQARLLKRYKRVSFVLPTIVFLILAAIHGSPLRAQDAPQGPVAPPPEHHVTRIGNESEPEAPPSLPEAEIVKSFSQDRKSTRLNSSHTVISYAVFCLKKKKTQNKTKEY